MCFNGTFNKTDISSSQQQCLDREEAGLGSGFLARIGWLLLIALKELGASKLSSIMKNKNSTDNKDREKDRSVPSCRAEENGKENPDPRTRAPLPRTYLQQRKVVHSLN